MTTVERRDRYPGARPFSGDRQDRRLFFGRQDETNDLFHRIQASRLLVLFGKSGIGKTSLLQAGVLPRLRENGFLPLPLRLNQDVDAVVDYFMSAIEEQCARENIDYTPGEPGSLWEFFKTAVFWRGDDLLTPILVLDQFEEIFTLQKASTRKAISAELGQLFSERIPAAVRERMGSDAVAIYREQAPNVKILICLRDEFLGNLQALAADIPGILDDRFRLAPMHADAARKAVIEPASLPQENSFTTPSFQYDDNTLDNLLQFLTGESDEAEPFQLQVLCHYVERQVAEREQEEPIIVSEDYLGDRRRMQRVLRNFYEDALKLLPSKGQQRRARRLCEDGLLSADGRRLSLEKQQIIQQYHVDEATLNTLVDARILRRESRLDSYYYELSHDSLARSIADNKSWRMPKWLGAAMAVIAGLMLVFGILYAVTLDQRQKAEAAALEAQQARQEAERILDFLTFDLRDKLEPIGRLDIVEEVQSLVEDYYRRVGVDSSDAKATHRRATSHLSKGNRLMAQGNLDQAWAEYQQSLELYKKTTEMNPDDYQYRRDLSVSYDKIGNIQKARGNLDYALDAYQKGLMIVERLANDEPYNDGWQRDLSVSYNKIGNIQKARGNLDDALDTYQNGLMIIERFANDDPSNPGWQDDLTFSYDLIGNIQKVRGNLDDALDTFQKGLGIRERLANDDPSNAGWQRDLSVSYDQIGDIQQVRGKLDDALDAFQKGLQIRERLANDDPSNAGWQRDLSVSYNKIGEIQQVRGKLDDALDTYQKGLRIRERLANDDPSNSIWQRDLSISYFLIGDILIKNKDLVNGIKNHRAALAISKRLYDLAPSNLNWQLDYVLSLWRIADNVDTKQEKGKAETIDNLTTALEILRKLEAKNLLTENKKSWIGRIEKQRNRLQIGRSD